MFALSFRTKLVVAMMLVVIGVTGTTLLVTQSRVQATYQRLSQERFDAQIRFFTEMQRNRLGFVAEKCQRLVDSVRLKAALEEGDVALLYDAAVGELREIYEAAGRRPVASFFRFLDAKGEVITTEDPRAGLLQPQARERLRQQLAAMHTIMSQDKNQQIGFLAAQNDEGRVQLQEVIISKVIDNISSQVRGALILAFPVSELMEEMSEDAAESSPKNSHASTDNELSDMAEQIKLGIWVGGVIYARSNAIPPAIRDSLSRQLIEEVSRVGMPKRDLVVSVAGVPHRVFYRTLNTASAFPLTHQVCLYSLAPALQEQKNLRTRILRVGAVMLVCALALSFLLSHGLSVPIGKLVVGTNEIRRGNFEVRVPVRGNDDLGKLAGSFNEMATGLAQKERYRQLLNMVADETVATQLLAGAVTLGGERRDASVLFCDIRGFTQLTENMPPEEVIDMLNEHMTALARVVKDHDGVVDKFVGDLIMAIFGAPLTRGDHARQAASCARQMIVERRKLDASSRYQIQIGIGIATGEMLAGCVGSSDRLNYTVVGPRVNLASRLCSRAEPSQIVIDQATRERLGTDAHVQPLPPLNLKGFSEPIAAFELHSIECVAARA